MNWSGLNDAVFGEFGQALAFTTTTGVKTLTVIVVQPNQPLARHVVPQNAMIAQVMRPEDVLVSARTSDVQQAGIDVQDTAVINGRTYWVVQLWPDDGGVTAMELRP